MAKFCKNCGAYLHENDEFCQDCGKPTDNRCEECGEILKANENFCPVCGKKKKEKSKLPIIIAVIAAVAAIGVVLFVSFDVTEMQEVSVDRLSFNIPASFVENESSSLNEKDRGIRTVSKLWTEDDDFIQIEVMSSKNSNFNANKISREFGGEKENLMGYDGYYNELDYAYTFSFEKENKSCTVYVSHPDLFDMIEVL